MPHPVLHLSRLADWLATCPAPPRPPSACSSTPRSLHPPLLPRESRRSSLQLLVPTSKGFAQHARGGGTLSQVSAPRAAPWESHGRAPVAREQPWTSTGRKRPALAPPEATGRNFKRASIHKPVLRRFRVGREHQTAHHSVAQLPRPATTQRRCHTAASECAQAVQATQVGYPFAAGCPLQAAAELFILADSPQVSPTSVMACGAGTNRDLRRRMARPSPS